MDKEMQQELSLLWCFHSDFLSFGVSVLLVVLFFCFVAFFFFFLIRTAFCTVLSKQENPKH